MQSIELRNQLLFYYGNPVGYQTKHGLIVDSIFYRQELEDWLIKKGLTVQWTNGVYDRLACGVSLGAKTLPVKSLRIWQLRPDMPIDMRFISLEQMSIKYGGPNPECYHPVYEGSTDTEDLEAIWNEFSRMALPHSEWPLAISDVIELYDETSSRFFYVDSCEIVPITFVAHNDQQTGIIQEKSNTQVDFSQMLQQEYESYMNQIQNYSIRKILDLAEEIADIKSIYNYLYENHSIPTEQKKWLASLENPLKSIRTTWRQMYSSPEQGLAETCEHLIMQERQKRTLKFPI